MQTSPPDGDPHIPAAHHQALMISGVPHEENPTKWWIWLSQTAGEAKQQDIAAKIGVDQSHISRWKQGYRPGVDFVVKTAEAYHRNVLEALVAAEVITEEQAQLREVRIVDPAELSTDALLEELRKRLRGD